MRVSALWVYPVKSARGIALTEARVDRVGFRFDRRFMVVDAAGKFVTQREQPRMALVTVRFDDDALAVSAPGMPVLAVPLRPRDLAPIRVTVWKETLDATRVSDEASRWFGEWLGVACDLVAMREDVERAVDPTFARPDDRVAFADGFPFLLASESSLADLNRRLEPPLPMTRFRPNIVVTGAEAFAEDRWRTMTAGSVAFRVAKPCARCAITTVNQDTGETGKEPLATLAAFRKVGKKVLFGQNLIHDNTGILRVGDPVAAGI